MKFLQIYNFTFARLEEPIFKDGTVVTSTRGASHFPAAAVLKLKEHFKFSYSSLSFRQS